MVPFLASVELLNFIAFLHLLLQLYQAGYKSLSQVAAADVKLLLQNIEHLSRRQAQQIIASAKVSVEA